MIHLTAIGLTPGGSGTVHIYTQYTEYRDGTYIKYRDGTYISGKIMHIWVILSILCTMDRINTLWWGQV
jgi:hypothetical protein